MRVLIANDLYGPSSAAGVATTQARVLARLGHEVHFLGTVQDPAAARSFEEQGVRVELVHVPSYPLRFRAWVSLWNPRGVAAVRAAVRRLRPQVVHFHNVHIFLSYRALRAAKREGAAVVMTVHDVMPFCFQKMFCFVHEELRPDGPPISFRAPGLRCAPCARFRWNPFKNRFVRRVLRRDCDKLIAVTDEMGRALAENGIPGAMTIANGLDVRSAAPREAGEAFRAAHGLVGRKVVLYGGRLDHRKGAEHLIRAMAKVLEVVPEAALLVVGSGLGGYETRMTELAHSLGLGGRIVVTGWLDQETMRHAYAAADVVCTPSLIFESFGLINAEGMLHGKPAVTSWFGGPKDVVEDGVTGFHVNPLDVAALADRLATLLAGDDLRARMGAAARRRVLDRFDAEARGADVAALYAELAGAAR